MHQIYFFPFVLLPACPNEYCLFRTMFCFVLFSNVIGFLFVFCKDKWSWPAGPNYGTEGSVSSASTVLLVEICATWWSQDERSWRVLGCGGCSSRKQWLAVPWGLNEWEMSSLVESAGSVVCSWALWDSSAAGACMGQRKPSFTFLCDWGQGLQPHPESGCWLPGYGLQQGEQVSFCCSLFLMENHFLVKTGT